MIYPKINWNGTYFFATPVINLYLLTFLFYYKMEVFDNNDPERRRFLMELEFVQCLANPEYLKC